jgi:hypothetical protein
MLPFKLFLLAWNFSLAAPAMLWGLAAVSIPVVIHFLNRRRVAVLEWGAMQFLNLGRRAHQRYQLTEMLLMLGRMALLALAVLAVCRPVFTPRDVPMNASATPTFQALGASNSEPRDAVIILDGSESMGTIAQGTTPRRQALEWARKYVSRLAQGSAVAVLDARERVRPVVSPASSDPNDVLTSLAKTASPAGACDLAAAVTQALELLSQTRNTRREVLILTDGRRSDWHTRDSARWNLIKSVYASIFSQSAFAPRVLAVEFSGLSPSDSADGFIDSISVQNSSIPANSPIPVKCTVANAGPAPLVRDLELLVDGVSVTSSRQHIGPLPPGGRIALSLETTIRTRGPHVLSVRLTPGNDPLAANDRADLPVEVGDGLPVLVVEGTTQLGSMPRARSFLAAALAPSNDPAPLVRLKVVSERDLNAIAATQARVIILNQVTRLEPRQSDLLEAKLAAGGGVLTIAGKPCDVSFYDQAADGKSRSWLPARFGEWLEQDPTMPLFEAPRLVPSTFQGPIMTPFADTAAPPLAQALVFNYQILHQAPDALICARLSTGEPWLVERPAGGGRACVLASSLNAESGTLPVNPDFVPWIHQLVFHLAGQLNNAMLVKPGTPLDLSLSVEETRKADVFEVVKPDQTRTDLTSSQERDLPSLRFDETFESGLYRFVRKGTDQVVANVVVTSDPLERDTHQLDTDDQRALSSDWPFAFASTPHEANNLAFREQSSASQPVWRWLIIAALLGLCCEVAATRQIAQRRRAAEETL